MWLPWFSSITVELEVELETLKREIDGHLREDITENKIRKVQSKITRALS